MRGGPAAPLRFEVEELLREEQARRATGGELPISASAAQLCQFCQHHGLFVSEAHSHAIFGVPASQTQHPLSRLGLCGARSCRHRSISGHSIAAERALKSSLRTTAGGKGPEIRSKTRLFAGRRAGGRGRLAGADAGAMQPSPRPLRACACLARGLYSTGVGSSGSGWLGARVRRCQRCQPSQCWHPVAVAGTPDQKWRRTRAA